MNFTTFFLFVAGALGLALTAFVTTRVLMRQRLYMTPRAVMRPRLLTGNELEFLRRVQRAVPELDVFAQVSQGALLEVSVPRTHPLYWSGRSQFDRKIADFVVCRKSDSAVLCLLELDDKTHDFSADARRDGVTGQAGLTTLRFWSRGKPTTEELRAAIAQTVGIDNLQSRASV